jgi:hypothetical protein
MVEGAVGRRDEGPWFIKEHAGAGDVVDRAAAGDAGAADHDLLLASDPAPQAHGVPGGGADGDGVIVPR